jgi:hypothetical protein
VLAAGGITDGRGVAAALMLGAHFVEAWDGREEELRASAEAREQFTLGHQAGDPDTGLVWAGEGLLRTASRQLDH